MRHGEGMDGAHSSWIYAFIDQHGYLGVLLLMFAETVFPPVPSEAVMPLAGFLAGQQQLSLTGAIVSGTAGSIAGAYVWFEVARRIGVQRLKGWARRHGRWLTLSPRDIDRVCKWFHKRGHLAVLFGRLVPAVRSLISVPAGIAGMKVTTFLVWSSVGTAIWSAALALVGFWLGRQFEHVASMLGMFSNVVIAGAVLLYIYRVITFRPHG